MHYNYYINNAQYQLIESAKITVFCGDADWPGRSFPAAGSQEKMALATASVALNVLKR